ncbi:phytoene/squalene synthase family protein [Streptomyces radiopugnans]|uniref:phytoene/squalene synthase family protein n=1 Tax=Streptomyces radiopugnans TaxID=403935 RepID=UPI003F1C3190
MFRYELESAGLRKGDLAAAYTECGKYLAHRNAAAYPVARFLLQPAKRPYYDAMLAFCGYADDLLDDPKIPVRERHARFDAFEEEFFHRLAAGTGSSGSGPEPVASGQQKRTTPRAEMICTALAHTVRTWGFSVDGVRRFLRTLRTDLDVSTYQTFGDLERYMSAVSGDMSQWVNLLLEPQNEEAASKAIALGYGIYLLDFITDIAEDISLGRIYLPLAELRDHGLNRQDLADAAARQRMTAPLRNLIRFQADRSRRYLDEAEGWHRLVHPSGRELPRQYLALGQNSLSQLLRDNCDIFRRRHSTRLMGTARAQSSTALSYIRAVRDWRKYPCPVADRTPSAAR